MLKLIVGVKGTGKTKTLIDMANAALDSVKGSVVVIEKGTKLTHEIKNKARLVNTEEYAINDANTLYGFVSGMYASNYDVSNVFIDSALKICNNDMAAFEKMLDELNALVEKTGTHLFITSSMPVEEASDTIKKYL